MIPVKAAAADIPCCSHMYMRRNTCPFGANRNETKQDSQLNTHFLLQHTYTKSQNLIRNLTQGTTPFISATKFVVFFKIFKPHKSNKPRLQKSISTHLIKKNQHHHPRKKKDKNQQFSVPVRIFCVLKTKGQTHHYLTYISYISRGPFALDKVLHLCEQKNTKKQYKSSDRQNLERNLCFCL